jgi:hypothetical protein
MFMRLHYGGFARTALVLSGLGALLLAIATAGTPLAS